MPVSIIRIASARKLDGYGAPCFHCEKIILDNEYVARTKTNGTKYYHCFCALSVNLVDNLGLRTAQTPFKPDRSGRILSRGWRKKIIFFGSDNVSGPKTQD
jgi:hypothetical protein